MFIHGLGGDAFNTWCSGTTKTDAWPYWLGAEFPEVGVWSLGYAASWSRWGRFLGLFSKRRRDTGYSMALPDRALQVLDLMHQHEVGQRPILFICHSLGGLLTKQILRASSDAAGNPTDILARNTRAVLFLSTPHTGAELATLLDGFRAAFGTTVSIADLKAHDPHLRNLLNWYRKRSVELGIRTRTYYEESAVSRAHC